MDRLGFLGNERGTSLITVIIAGGIGMAVTSALFASIHFSAQNAGALKARMVIPSLRAFLQTRVSSMSGTDCATSLKNIGGGPVKVFQNAEPPANEKINEISDAGGRMLRVGDRFETLVIQRMSLIAKDVGTVSSGLRSHNDVWLTFSGTPINSQSPIGYELNNERNPVRMTLVVDDTTKEVQSCSITGVVAGGGMEKMCEGNPTWVWSNSECRVGGNSGPAVSSLMETMADTSNLLRGGDISSAPSGSCGSVHESTTPGSALRSLPRANSNDPVIVTKLVAVRNGTSLHTTAPLPPNRSVASTIMNQYYFDCPRGSVATKVRADCYPNRNNGLRCSNPLTQSGVLRGSNWKVEWETKTIPAGPLRQCPLGFAVGALKPGNLLECRSPRAVVLN